MARILKEYPHVALKNEDIGEKIDFGRIFGRPCPVHVEIGSGKGTFLVNQAKSQSHIGFLGIEWASKYYRHAVDRIGRWGIENVRMLRTDAGVFVAESIPDGSVDCFHIYFPDPWPKKRHHKRRFYSSSNLEHLLRCLKPDGIIKLATDHGGYFEQMQEVTAGQSERLEEIDFLATDGADEGEWVGTNFERKYIKEKRTINTLAVRKR